MRRDVALLVALALAGATAISTGATPLATDDVTDDIQLSPASDYAYLDDDGELAIDVSASNPALDADGVNDDGLTDLGDVFRVRYAGSEHVRVWFTADSDAVTFLADGRPVQSRANAVVLGSNESETVGLAIDARKFDGRIDEFEVHATVADSERVGAARVDDANTESDGDSGPSIRVGRPTADRRLVMASDVSAGETVAVPFDRLAVENTDERTLTLEEVRVRRTGAGNLGFDVEAGVPVPSDADIDGTRVLGTVRVTPTLGGDTVEAAVFRFGVRGIDAERMVVYRYSENASSRLAVEKLGEGRIAAVESPGFSTFVVAVERPDRTTEETPTRTDERRDTETSDLDERGVPAGDSATDTGRSTVDSRGVDGESAGDGSPSTDAPVAISDAMPAGWLTTVAGIGLGLVALGWRGVRGR